MYTFYLSLDSFVSYAPLLNVSGMKHIYDLN